MNIKQTLLALTENWPVKVICFVFAVFLSELYRGTLLEKRYLVVPLTVKNESSLTPAEQYPTKVKVMLWGDAAATGSINEQDIVASIKISDINTEGTYQLPVETRLIGTFPSLGNIEISTEPAIITLRLAPSMRKQVPIMLSLRGIPADDYEITKSSLEPQTIEIEGPANLVEKVYSLNTEPFSVEARTHGFSTTARLLNNEPLISILGTGEAKVAVQISETTIQKQFSAIPIYFEKLKEGFSVTSDKTSGAIEVRGPKKLLKTWNPPDHILTVSCETITESGVYTLPVETHQPEKYSNIQIIQSSPQSVQITVELHKDKEDETVKDTEKNTEKSTGKM